MGNRVSNNSSLNNSWSILRNSFIGYILNISISGLSLLEVSSTVVIIDSIVISIYWGLSKIRGSIARGSNKRASRGSCSNSYQGRYKESLHC